MHISNFKILSALFAFVYLFNQAHAQPVYDGGVIQKTVKANQKPIAITSPNSDWSALAELAFSTHGGYRLVEPREAAFIFKLSPVAEGEVLLEIESGEPLKRLFSQEVRGSSTENAVLRACDLAVMKTLGIPGYFAGELAFVGRRSTKRELWTSDLFFQNAKQLTQDNSQSVNPQWSPGGKSILYTGYYRTGFPDLLLIDVQTHLRKVIADYKGTNTGGAFSPNAQQIAMVLSATGSSELYVGNQYGRNLKQLTRGKGVEASPSWSPDGSSIVFTSDMMGGPQLFVVPASGGKPQHVSTRLSGYVEEPDWNHLNSELLVFTGSKSGSLQLGIYDFKKNEARWLTSGPGECSEAKWLNDGRHIVYVQNRNKHNGLRILDTISGKDTALHSSGFGNASQPDFVYTAAQ